MSFSIATFNERLRQLHTHINSIEGKTVKQVVTERSVVAIKWHDDTYTVLNAKPYGDHDALMEDVMIKDTRLEHLASELDLVEKEAVESVREQRRLQLGEQNRACKLAQFNRLKAELGL